MDSIGLTIRGLERGVVGRCLKARTILGDVGELTMAHDMGIGILGRQFLEEGEHRSLLGFSPGVIRMTFFIETAFVADAE